MQTIAILLFPLASRLMSLAAVSVFEFANIDLGGEAYGIRYLSRTGGQVPSSFGTCIGHRALRRSGVRHPDDLRRPRRCC